MPDTDIFVSYAAEDHKIAEVILDLLVRSGVVGRSAVFCFERPGAQSSAGVTISERVRKAMQAPVSLALISRNYVLSNYCVAEFGYLRFGASYSGSSLVPLLVPPTKVDDVGHFFMDLGLLDGGTAAGLNEMIDSIQSRLHRRVEHSVWEDCRKEAQKRLQRIGRQLSPHTSAEVELCDLPPAAMRKILAVRRGNLSIRERQWFYAAFQKLEPRYHVPNAPVAGEKTQAENESVRPLDDSVVRMLATATGTAVPPIDRPLTATGKELIRDWCSDAGRRIFEEVLRTRGKGIESNDILQAWRNVYNYLSCTSELGTSEQLARSDVILVPGARKGHVFRADEAAAVARIAPSLSLVLFSGGHPIFDEEQDLPFGEADALAERFVQQYPDLPTSISLRVDGRARTTAETVAHMRLHLQDVVNRIGRPVNLTLVTSPYHMRRFGLLVNSATERMSHLVGNVYGSLSTASFDWGVISFPRSPAQEKLAQYGIGLYMLEIAKLYGGRATGEF